MKINEELRTFTDDAHKLSLGMIQIVDNINLGLLDSKKGASLIDDAAREMSSIQEAIKDLAYKLGREGVKS